MSASSALLSGILFASAYLLAPASLIWGWVRWVRLPKIKTVTSILSFAGFGLASMSALLALLSVAYAKVHVFKYYDPELMRIFRWGFLLSAAGFIFALGGIWRKNPLQWLAPASAVGTLTFWLVVAAGE
jgi:hypothetical protein